ncbi:hypothetical protein THAOC_21516, partial [Thalassiosira oceanica]
MNRSPESLLGLKQELKVSDARRRTVAF